MMSPEANAQHHVTRFNSHIIVLIMKEYNYKIKGAPYNVKINSVEENIAKVEVNGIEVEVELEKPVAAPVKTIEPPKEAQEAVAAGVLAVRAPLPGTINDILVTVGQTVKAGDTLVVLEAMKMENNIDAERGGKILEIKVNKGSTVMEGSILVTIG